MPKILTVLAALSPEALEEALFVQADFSRIRAFYGNGQASNRIATILSESLRGQSPVPASI